jgi:hypothetical protein
MFRRRQGPFSHLPLPASLGGVAPLHVAHGSTTPILVLRARLELENSDSVRTDRPVVTPQFHCCNTTLGTLLPRASRQDERTSLLHLPHSRSLPKRQEAVAER